MSQHANYKLFDKSQFDSYESLLLFIVEINILFICNIRRERLTAKKIGTSFDFSDPKAKTVRLYVHVSFKLLVIFDTSFLALKFVNIDLFSNRNL